MIAVVKIKNTKVSKKKKINKDNIYLENIIHEKKLNLEK